MLYINGERLNTTNNRPDYDLAKFVEDYRKVIAEARAHYGNTLFIETNVRPRRDKKTRAMRFPGPRGLLKYANVNYRFDEEVSSVELRYSPTLLSVDKTTGTFTQDSPNILIKKGAHSVDITRNPDLAYYVLRCGLVGHTPAEGKKFHLFDAKTIDEVNAKRRKLQGQILGLIYSSIPEQKLRVLAKSFGVSDVNLRSLDSVREALYAKLQDAEAQKAKKPGADVRGYKEFIESAEVKLYDKIAAMCRDAESEKKLVFNKEDRRWEIDYKDGGGSYILKELSGDEFGHPLDALVGFLITEEEYLRKLENAMGVKTKEAKKERAPVPVIDTPKITPEMVFETKKVPSLKKMLKELDPDVTLSTTLKADDVRRMILERITPEEVQETKD